MPSKSKQPAVSPAPAKKAPSALEVAVEILARKGEPMKVVELARAVVKSGRAAGLKGKTPEATISAHLYVAARSGRQLAGGRRLEKSGRGEVRLVEAEPAPAKRHGRAAPAKA